MSVNAIFASKMYKASKHKDKIKAALANPINTELVLQLNEYLNEDDLEDIQNDIDKASSDDESKEVDKSAESGSSNEESDEKIRPSVHSAKPSASAPAPSGPDHHLSEEVAKMEEDRDAELNPEKKTFDVQRQEAPVDDDVAESTNVAGSAITIKASLEGRPMISTDALIGTLNAREDTCGVCRAVIKDSEIWVHYNDSVNLNNVMEPAIALLNASNYGYLNFNRLARTENAIVFTIADSAKPVEPIQETAND